MGEDVFSFDLFFSSTSENARTHERSRKRENKISIEFKTEEREKFCPEDCPLLFKDQQEFRSSIKNSKNSNEFYDRGETRKNSEEEVRWGTQHTVSY
jgi:hypothetical protein